MEFESVEISLLKLAPPTWTRTTLGEIVARGGGSIQTGPFGSQLHASDYVPVGVPSIMPVNIGENRLIREGIACIRESDAQRLSKHIVRKGDIIYSRRGDVERRAIVRESEEGWFCGTGCLKVRLGHGVIVPEFAAFYLGHPEVRSWIVRHAVGITMPNLNTSIMESVPFLLPPLDQQQAIAETLQSLDDKIEQNRPTGAKLEELARAVFKAWFVDFEPVKAKAAGATAFPGMPPETFEALPTRFTNSDLGPVPVGWGNCSQRVAELERAGTLLIGDGYRAKRSELADMGVPFIRAGNVNGTIITDGAELLGKPAIEKAGAKRSQVWDTVFTSKGTVGRIGLVTPATGDVVYAPQVCFWRATNREALSPFLLHLWMKSESFTSQWMSVKGQTDMADFVSLGDQRAMTMLVPPPEVQRGFDNIVSPIVELLAASAAESAKLAALRDYLLPRLLSGRVRVKEAERVVSNAS